MCFLLRGLMKQWKETRKNDSNIFYILYERTKAIKEAQTRVSHVVLEMSPQLYVCPCFCLSSFCSPENWPTHFVFCIIANILKNMESTCKNLDFWPYLKYQKIWQRWAHMATWQQFTEDGSSLNEVRDPVYHPLKAFPFISLLTWRLKILERQGTKWMTRDYFIFYSFF